MKFVRASSTIPFSNRLTEEEVNEKLAGYFAFASFYHTDGDAKALRLQAEHGTGLHQPAH